MSFWKKSSSRKWVWPRHLWKGHINTFKWMESCGCELRKAPYTSIIVFGCLLQKPDQWFHPIGTHSSDVTGLQGGVQSQGGILTLTSKTKAFSALEGGKCSPYSRLEDKRKAKGKGAWPPHQGPCVAGQLFSQKSHPDEFSAYEMLAIL